MSNIYKHMLYIYIYVHMILAIFQCQAVGVSLRSQKKELHLALSALGDQAETMFQQLLEGGQHDQE